MVVGVFLGGRNTGGFGVEIVRAVGNGAVMTVQYVETSPGRDAITAQMLTAPYHLAAMPSTTARSGFRRSRSSLLLGGGSGLRGSRLFSRGRIDDLVDFLRRDRAVGVGELAVAGVHARVERRLDLDGLNLAGLQQPDA